MRLHYNFAFFKNVKTVSKKSYFIDGPLSPHPPCMIGFLKICLIRMNSEQGHRQEYSVIGRLSLGLKINPIYHEGGGVRQKNSFWLIVVNAYINKDL